MLIHQFHRLTKEQQYRYLIGHGACVADYNTTLEDRLLFQLQDYYVEIVFMRHTDHIIGVNCFRGTKTLDPYLEEISIEHLLS